jgi:hypothetical protein
MVAFDPATEKVQTVTIPTAGAIVRNTSVDSTRARLWLALSGTQRLGRIDLAPGAEAAIPALLLGLCFVIGLLLVPWGCPASG